MKKKFTPGPWKAELVTSGDKIAHPVYWNIAFSSGYDPNRAAINVYKGGKSTLKEAEANARLIAAAPELLEACERSLEELEAAYKMLKADNTERVNNPTNPIYLLKQAITKATGETQNLQQ